MWVGVPVAICWGISAVADKDEGEYTLSASDEWNAGLVAVIVIFLAALKLAWNDRLEFMYLVGLAFSYAVVYAINLAAIRFVLALVGVPRLGVAMYALCFFLGAAWLSVGSNVLDATRTFSP